MRKQINNSNSGYSFYHENIALYPDPPNSGTDEQIAKRATQLIASLTIPAMALLPKKIIDKLSVRVQNLVINPTVSAYKSAGKALLKGFGLDDFVMILVLADSESGFNPSAVNENARGMLQLQLSNLKRLTDEFISNKRSLIPLLGSFYGKFVSHDPSDLKALTQGGIDFSKQALHPIIQAIPGIMLFQKNMNTLKTYFERFDDVGWQPRGTVSNKVVCSYITNNPQIFKTADSNIGKQALMTIIHINGQPWLTKPDKSMSYPDRPLQDAQKYVAFRDQLATVVNKLYKSV